MKRYMSFVLAVVLVLGLAAVTSAEGMGSLEGDNTISATLDVSANIGKYASISAEGLNFGVLEGKVAVYTASPADTESDFVEKVLDKFGATAADLVRRAEDGRGSLKVEANCDVKISLEFSGNNWLDSKTLFAITKDNQAKAWAASNIALDQLPAYFSLQFAQDTVHEFKVDGAIYIERISQQSAGDYSGTLTVTVEAINN
ncbi:hypothetical protein [Candidatus Darwinibacter acetoxidans]